MVMHGIDHVQIAAPNDCEAAARNFFCDILGLDEVIKPEPLISRGGCWFQVGSQQLHIGVEEPFTPATKAHPAFSVSDIEGLYMRLVDNGFHCKWDKALPDIRRFYVNDPWGNRLEFLELPVQVFM
jgi:catechol 2,3-dioxygenase-like lactoylglutathione lyase family enzyme